MTAKTTTERVAAMREARKQAGLKEIRNLWAYPEDEVAIREHATKLQRRTERKRKGK